jgi:indole-3-glycerol phosphate synthase
MDAARPARVLGAVPPACVPVHLSGLRTASDVARVAAEGAAHAALIGEALMREDDPSALLASMVAAAATR